MKKNVDWNYLNRFFKNFPLFILLFTSAYAAVPSRITYQGRLSKSGVGAAGKHTITVQFITASGEKLPASQTFDVDVPVSGDFSLNIDNIPPDADWINGLPKMRVIVGGETLTPDQSFSATPYALVARNVENLDTSKVKLEGDAGGALLSSWQDPKEKSKISANVIVGTVPYVVPDDIMPSKIHGTALVMNSTSSLPQTIQPKPNVLPLKIIGAEGASSIHNLFEVWDNEFVIPTERFHIKGSGTAYFNGNVGIGTDSPMQKLRVNGNDQLSLFASQTGTHNFGTVLALQTEGDGAQNGPRLSFLKSHSKSWSMGVQTGESKNFSIWEDGSNEGWGTERFTIAPGGNVGIGTSTPGESLEVRGNIKLSNASISGGIRALTPTNWGYSTSYPVVLLGPSSGVGTVSIGYDPSGNPNGSFGGDGREVLFRNGAKFVTPTSANNAFYLNQLVLKDGNVGINKADPAKPLDVGGDANISGKITSSAVGINNPSPTKALDVVGDTNITGKVGINNPAPTKALDVVGDANISGKITGATYGFGGMYYKVPEKMSLSRPNPVTGDYSCPAGFTQYHLMFLRADNSPDDYGANVYFCMKLP